MTTVRHIMTREVIWVLSDSRVKDAFRLMKRFSIRHIPVLHNEHLVGVVSEGDVLLRSRMDGKGIRVPEEPVGNIMSENVVTCFPDSQLGDVAATMIACKIDCLPVVDETKLVGIVTTTDLLDAFCRNEELDGHDVMPLEFAEPTRRPLVEPRDQALATHRM